MADVEYNYTKSPIAVDRLEQEIRSSAIVTALRHVTLLGTDQLTVTMADTLTEGDGATLDAVVAAHGGVPLTYPAPMVRIDQPVDSDNMPIQRQKVTKTGWSFNRANIQFQTGVAGARYKKKDGVTDIGGVTVKLYDVNGADVTAHDQTTLDGECVVTQVDWEPPYDDEVIAGALVLFAQPAGDMYLWVVGVPDVPAIYGGSKEFVTNEGLHFLVLQVPLRADGRASKPLSYNATYHTNKIRAIIRHTAGDKVRMQFTYEHFRA